MGLFKKEQGGSPFVGDTHKRTLHKNLDFTATEQYKLDFIVDGEVYHSRTTNGASRINPPIDPEKTGFVFDGWYFDEEFTEKYIVY